MKIKNVGEGTHGLLTTEGYRPLEPGQEIEADVPDEEIEVVKKTKWFSFDGAPAGEGPPVSNQ